MTLFADIIINKKSPSLDREFTYRIPPHMEGEICRGMLVQVPFNRMKLEGVVMRVHDTLPDMFDTRDISDILDPEPVFTEEMLELADWVAEYYHCSRVSAMQAMLPAGMSSAGRLPRTAYYNAYTLSEGHESRLTSSRRRQLACILADRPEGEASEEFLLEQGFAKSFLYSCCKCGVLEKHKKRLFLYGSKKDNIPAGFNKDQQKAYDIIKEEAAGQGRPVLIHGVTGSGKTEIYIKLIKETAAKGKQCILLVPEIALSAQMLDMMCRRLPFPVAMLHSGLLPAQRRTAWKDIAESKIKVILGARSAVFAPAPDLGLIIIDEEHESSYKQDNNPRFHAVAVAEKRAALCGAQLVLGSATPSVESYYKAQNGVYALAALPRQYYPAPPPQVSVVDMRQELKSGHKLIFSRELIAALDDVLSAGKQSILFLNRRGYYTFVSCRDCGHSMTCPHCAVTMCLHNDRHGGKLKCHYCGNTVFVPNICPSCGSKHIRHIGVGTQRVEDELKKLFPDARVLRLDSDVMEQRDSHLRIFDAMRRGEADILVGTQMVAKGLDFPDLELAAVLAADSLLNLPDWRASERTFQLLSQVCGRAGRREQQGRAIIQTYTPEVMAVRYAAERDYAGFYREELFNRQLHGYPPYGHLLRLLFTCTEQPALIEICAAYAHYLEAELGDIGEICGPADAPYARIKDRFRRQIIVKAKDISIAGHCAQKAWNITVQQERVPADLRFAMDMDPMSML